MELSKGDVEAPSDGHAPDTPDTSYAEWALDRLQSGEPLDNDEYFEVLAALTFSSQEDADEFAAWVDRRRRGCGCDCHCEA
jgi:hypothetical protein